MENIEAPTAAYPRGVRCTVGLNTPAMITGELPLIILLNEQVGATEAKRSDFTEGPNVEKTQERRSENISTINKQKHEFQEPGTSAMGNVSDAPLVAQTRQKPPRDGSQYAAGSAHGSLVPTADENRYPLNIVIRAYRFDKTSKPIYNIIEQQSGHVKGTLEVDEKAEMVRLRDDTGLHELTGTGGLCNFDNTMNITWPSNQQLSTIDINNIHIKSDNTLFDVVPLMTTPIRSENQYLIIHNRRRVATISEIEDSIQLVVLIKLTNEQFKVFLLQALRLLYRHDIQCRPMPHGILSNKSQAELAANQFHYNMNCLRKLGGMSLRMACCIDANNWFADIMFLATSDIALILAKAGDRYEFRDLSGRTHFIATQDDCLISVFSSSSSSPYDALIGTIDLGSDEIRDSNNGLVMKVNNTRDVRKNVTANRWFQGRCFIIDSVPRGMWSSVKIEGNFYATNIYLRTKMNINCKALIIAYGAVLSDKTFGMSKLVVPRVQQYP